MTASARPSASTRPRLSKERVLSAAMVIADRGGLSGLTIRSLAKELGTKPMSVYYYVASKDELLDALVDVVFEEIELPDPDGEWREEMRRRAHSARARLKQHCWAIGLLESRASPGPATLRHHDRVLDCLRRAGFSAKLTAHAYALIDSYVYGFALQEASLPFEGSDTVEEVAEPIMALMATGEYPAMVEMATTYYLQPGYDFADEFEFGLDLILDGLERRRR
ncbi:TetR/AcrR family transcriptional regulator [Amycolatopsis sp. NPDC051045]|uniref:TetR/AcrR family transcriptional regulator n=1 Tax=Amycolatopsis sp. NPDC051045 TaxID=3156922 RepID=UPI0034223056